MDLLGILRIKDSNGNWVSVPGLKGDTGEPFKILGIYATAAALEADVTDPNVSDVYLVGTTGAYDIYLYLTDGWHNTGRYMPKGDTGDPAPAASITSAVETWLAANVDPETGYVLDRSLTQTNAAAPADLVGDLIGNICDIALGNNICNPDKIEVGSLASDGTVDTTAAAYSTTDFIPVSPNTYYTFTEFRINGTASNSRKYCALYDENKTLIQGSYQNVSPAGFLTVNSGNAKYIRFSSTAGNNKFVSVGEDVPSTFEPYTEIYVSKLNYEDSSIPVNAIYPHPITEEKINLYDSSEDVVGSLTTSGNIDQSGTNYKTTGPIKIVKGHTYIISPRLRMLAFYTDSIANSSCFIVRDANEKLSVYSFISEYDGYMRIVYNINYPLTTVESSYSGELTLKNEEGIALSNTQINQVKNEINTGNILNGKKWVVCGDSFTNNGGTGTTIQTGKYSGKPYTYPWIIGNDDRQDMDIVKFFEGGRTLAFPAEPGTFANSLTNPNADWYYQNIPADADYITIYLGINDEHHSSESSGGDGEDNTGIIPLGTITDSTTATYYGAWNVVLSWLITNRPNAHIGIIVTNGIANNDNYRLAQIAIAQKYGIPYIDMNGDARTPAMLRTSNPNIDASVKQALIEKWSANYPSNQHPNDAAQLFESAFIENFLRSI